MKVEASEPVTMENLKIHNGFGQNFGYILYRATIGTGKILKFDQQPKDRAQVFLLVFLHKEYLRSY